MTISIRHTHYCDRVIYRLLPISSASHWQSLRTTQLDRHDSIAAVEDGHVMQVAVHQEDSVPTATRRVIVRQTTTAVRATVFVAAADVTRSGLEPPAKSVSIQRFGPT